MQDFNEYCNRDDLVEEEDDTSNFNDLIERTERKIQQTIEEDSPKKMSVSIFDEQIVEENTQKAHESSVHSSDQCMEEMISPFRGIARLTDHQAKPSW